MSLTAFFGRRSNGFLLSFSLSLVILIGYLDYETGLELGLYIFYFLPIILVTWYMGSGAGTVLSFTCALLWLMADTMLGHQYSYALVPYWNTVMRFTSFVITVVFLTKLRNSFESQKHLSRTDHLTGLLNGRTFSDISTGEIERSRRYSRTFSVGFLDVDNFKSINDRFGHKAGDELLKTVGSILQESLRKVDVVARVGGDEFIFLLPETGAVPARIVFNRVLDRLLYQMEMKEWPVTFSIGVATFHAAPQSVDDMIRTADALMYDAKNSGKNTIRQEVFGQPTESGRPGPFA